ncbi:MAG TPA: site-2 protease family protein, partial [Candidatus Methylacidiphilales bacterium]|nr:site-2 protease family protein [Candidatus Methylacidiphilales bacterium]
MLFDILYVLFLIILVVLLFNVMILVHELGHYWAALWRGLVVERFGIWFGKPILRTQINGVEFVIGCIPAGGYVQLPQMAPMEAIEGKSDMVRAELPPVKPLDKIIVAFAGPLFSFMLAVFFACIVWVIGRPVSDNTTVIGYIPNFSPSITAVPVNGTVAEPGLKVGDKVLSVDGKEVTKFSGIGPSIHWSVVSSQNDAIRFKVERPGQPQPLYFDVTPYREPKAFWQRRSLRQVLIGQAHNIIVSKIPENSPVSKVLKPGDRIVAVNGQELLSLAQLNEYIAKQRRGFWGLDNLTPVHAVMDRVVTNNERQIALTVDRPIDLKATEVKYDRITLPAVVPRAPAEPSGFQPMLGFEIATEYTLRYDTPYDQIANSVYAMYSTFSALLSPRGDIGLQHLSGPAGILNT